MAHIRHEHDDPSPDGDLAATVEEEEDGTYPGHSVCERQSGLIERSTSFSTRGRWMIPLILGASFRPESAGGIDDFENRGSSLCFSSDYAIFRVYMAMCEGWYTYQQIIECIPFPAHFGDQSCRNKRTDCGPNTIEPMETPEYLVRIGETANPHIPPCVLDTASQSNENIHDHQDREWWVRRYDCKGKYMTCWADKCHPSTTETLMNQIT